MASFTRKAIEEAFLKLLDARPLNQITVKDIVEECGVNRNTFYYHFRTYRRSSRIYSPSAPRLC